MTMTSIDERADDQSRRSFIKKTAYVAPMILTLKAVPAFASAGSGASDGGISDGFEPPEYDVPIIAAPRPGVVSPDRGQSFGRERRPRRGWVFWRD